jgi:hypothetical protein
VLFGARGLQHVGEVHAADCRQGTCVQAGAEDVNAGTAKPGLGLQRLNLLQGQDQIGPSFGFVGGRS